MQAKHDGKCGLCGEWYYIGTPITWNRRTTNPNGERYHLECWNKAKGIVAPSTTTRVVTVDEDENEVPESIITPVAVDPQTFIADPITANITLNGKHKLAGVVKTLLSLRMYPFLYGGPGGGKSYLCQQLAADMGLDFLLFACSRDMLTSQIVGVKSPLTGDYFPTKFAAMWENGGVVLFDECANADGNILNFLNGAMAQKEITFPSGERIRMHKNFFLIFADNSAGYGNDPLFPERADMGSAFRDRLAYVEFTYDTRLERAIIGSIIPNERKATTWHEAVLMMREALTTAMIPVFASPRFAYDSARLLAEGTWTMEAILATFLYRGMTADIVALAKSKVASGVRHYTYNS